jgi:hypothetical protein
MQNLSIGRGISYVRIYKFGQDFYLNRQKKMIGERSGRNCRYL